MGSHCLIPGKWPAVRMRSFICVVFIAIIVDIPTGDAVADARADPKANRPNILWLQTDSMDGRLLDPTSPYFYKLKLDRFKEKLLDSGTVFTRHYANSPQCVPSRTSMLTGRYPHEVWTANNGQGIARSTSTGELDENCVSEWSEEACTAFAAQQNISTTFLDIVSASGYALHFYGRFDIGNGILQEYPDTSGDGFHGGPDLGILARGANIVGETMAAPWNLTETGDEDPFEDDALKAADVVDYLYSNPYNSDQPFFMWLGLLAPHPPYDTNHTWENYINNSNIDVPPQVPRDAVHPFDRFQSIAKGVWDANYTDTEIKDMRAAYWGGCAEALELIFSVLDAANATGRLNNTIVIYTSDHGELALSHHQYLKNSMYEGSSRVPLIISAFSVPGLTPAAGTLVHNFTSHLDILPTIAELVGGTLPYGARGSSLVPFLKADGAAAVINTPARADYVAMEFHSNLASTGSFGLRQGAYKLITFGHTFQWFNASSYPPMLFNVDEDPEEIHDIAGNNSDIVAAMTAVLEAEWGGPGSLAAIDAAQMESNLALYRQFYEAQCSGEDLMTTFLNTFIGPTAAQIDEWVAAWSGAEPSKAAGNGTCPTT